MSKLVEGFKKIFKLNNKVPLKVAESVVISEMVKPSLGSAVAAASQVMRTSKPHVPLIRFRKDNHNTSADHGPPSSKSSQSQSLGTSSGSGSLEDWQIPAKYRRRPISPEEIAYINTLLSTFLPFFVLISLLLIIVGVSCIDKDSPIRHQFKDEPIRAKRDFLQFFNPYAYYGYGHYDTHHHYDDYHHHHHH